MYDSRVLSAEDSLEELLKQLGITRRYRGYAYLISAVGLAQSGAGPDRRFCQSIAEQYGENRQNVYAAICNCMGRAGAVNPQFLTVLMDCAAQGQELRFPEFIRSLAVWIERHHAVLIFDDKSSFGRIVWIKKGCTEPASTQ